ncbi:MAG TPA: GNAT family N-acetyltransferase, partial [Rhodospirillaceae bacterium]|nr:GNAT family N-acetyltransferase [Rhodospirillaceae bacterium]
MTPITIATITNKDLDACLDGLADVLHATVQAGGSVNFIL